MDDMQSMTPLQIATHLLADVTAVRDKFVAEMAEFLEPGSTPEAQARLDRSRANLQVAIDGANDQIAMFQRRVDEFSGEAP